MTDLTCHADMLYIEVVDTDDCEILSIIEVVVSRNS